LVWRDKMNLEIKCLCGCGHVTKLEGDFPMTLGVKEYYCKNPFVGIDDL